MPISSAGPTFDAAGTAPADTDKQDDSVSARMSPVFDAVTRIAIDQPENDRSHMSVGQNMLAHSHAFVLRILHTNSADVFRLPIDATPRLDAFATMTQLLAYFDTYTDTRQALTSESHFESLFLLPNQSRVRAVLMNTSSLANYLAAVGHMYITRYERFAHYILMVNGLGASLRPLLGIAQRHATDSTLAHKTNSALRRLQHLENLSLGIQWNVYTRSSADASLLDAANMVRDELAELFVNLVEIHARLGILHAVETIQA